VSNLPFSIFAALMALAAMAFLGRLNRGSWLAPSAFAPLAWLGLALLPLITAPDFWVSPTGVWVIVLLVFCTQVGAYIGEGRQAPVKAPGEPWRKTRIEFRSFLATQLLRWCLIFSLISLLGTILLTFTGFEAYRLPFSAEGFLDLGRLLSVQRYDEIQDPFLIRLLRVWDFPAALFAGMAFPLISDRRKKMLTFVWLCPALLNAAAVAARAGAVLCLVAWLAGSLAAQVYVTRGTFRVFRRRRLLIGGITLVSVVLFGLAIGVLRAGFERVHDYLRVWDALRPGAFGYLAAFGRWYENYDPSDLGCGVNTLRGLFVLLRLHPRQLGFGLEGVNVGGILGTNIFTIFRGLIVDVSLPGSMIASLGFGLFSGWAYMRSSQGQSSYVAPLAAYYAVLLFSPVICIFMFNSLLGAWILSWVFLVWVEWRYKALVLRESHAKMGVSGTPSGASNISDFLLTGKGRRRVGGARLSWISRAARRS